MLVNTRRLAIEWGDCDPAGIVFYPRYFAMFDASTASLFQRALLSRRAALVEELYEPVASPRVIEAAVPQGSTPGAAESARSGADRR